MNGRIPVSTRPVARTYGGPRVRTGTRAAAYLATALAAALAACSGDRTTLPAEDPTTPPPTVDYVSVNGFSGATLGARITAAINSLPSTGGVVDASEIAGAQQITSTVQLGSSTKPIELRLGNATITASTVAFVLYNRSKVIGDGSTVLVQASGANASALISGTGLRGCEVANLTLDGNKAANTGPTSGVLLTDADGCRVHDVTVQNTVGTLRPAIYFTGDSTRNNTISYNLVKDAGVANSYAYGIYIPGPGNRVLYNQVRNAAGFAILAPSCSGCIVEGNYLSGNPAGIAVGTGTANASANTNVISGNVVTGGNTTAWGMISVYRQGGNAPVGAAITGNVVRDVERGHGIMVNDAEQVSIAGNVLRNIGAAYEEGYGILVMNSRAVVVTGGSIAQTGSFGVGISGSANVKVDGVVITDAARSGNGASGVGLDVLAQHSTSVSLTGLTIFDTQATPSLKKMPYCIDFAMGGSTDGVVVGGNLYDDGTNSVGCRLGNLRTSGASRVTTF